MYGVDCSSGGRIGLRCLVSQRLREGTAWHVLVAGRYLGVKGRDSLIETVARRIEAHVRVSSTPSCLVGYSTRRPRPLDCAFPLAPKAMPGSLPLCGLLLGVRGDRAAGASGITPRGSVSSFAPLLPAAAGFKICFYPLVALPGFGLGTGRDSGCDAHTLGHDRYHLSRLGRAQSPRLPCPRPAQGPCPGSRTSPPTTYGAQC